MKLYRSLLDNPYSNRPDYLAVWIHLLLTANHKETSFIFNNETQVVKSGQLLTGRKVLSEKTGICESQIYKILNYFEKVGQIEQQKNNKFTIITILNWDKFQGNGTTKEQPSNSDVTTTRQPRNTYKNVKNVKKDNKDIYPEILEYWNSKEIIVHKVLSAKSISLIKTKLESGYTIDDIKEAIKSYWFITTNTETKESYWFTYKFTLEDFLNPKNFEKFKDFEAAHTNFLIKEEKRR